MIKQNKNTHNSNGFTIVEVLIVIGVLAVIAIVAGKAVTARRNKETAKTSISTPESGAQNASGAASTTPTTSAATAFDGKFDGKSNVKIGNVSIEFPYTVIEGDGNSQDSKLYLATSEKDGSTIKIPAATGFSVKHYFNPPDLGQQAPVNMYANIFVNTYLKISGSLFSDKKAFDLQIQPLKNKGFTDSYERCAVVTSGQNGTQCVISVVMKDKSLLLIEVLGDDSATVKKAGEQVIDGIRAI